MESLTELLVSFFQLRNFTLFYSYRQLKHPSIVKFYGTNLQKIPYGTKVVMVLELCRCSLKSQIMSHPENAPARLPDEVVRRRVLLWAVQILDALRYVHGKGFVQQSLRLENVLVSLCDAFRPSHT